MNYKRALMYGILIWVFVFLVAMLAFPLRLSERLIFESVVPVGLVLAVTLASVTYFKTVKTGFVYMGMSLGILWMLVSLLLDSLVFSWIPMKIPLPSYIKDIAIAYMVILLIPISMGYILQNERNNSHL